MLIPNSLDDMSLLEHEPLKTYCFLHSKAPRRGKEHVVHDFVKKIQSTPQYFEVVQEWLNLAFDPLDNGIDNRRPTAHDPNMLAFFFECYRRLEAKDIVTGLIHNKQREFFKSLGTNNTQFSVCNGLGATESEQAVNVGSDQSHSRANKRTNPKRSRNTKTSRRHSDKPSRREANEASSAKRMRKCSDDIPSQVANHLPNLCQVPSQDDCPDGMPPSPVRPIPSAIDSKLVGSSRCHVPNTTHAGSGKQDLTNNDLSRKRRRDASDQHLTNADHFMGSPSKLTSASAPIPSARSIRPLPRKTGTKHILPRYGEKIPRAAELSKQALNKEGVGRLLTDSGKNTSSMPFQTTSMPPENWTEDNDQDDPEDIDDIAIEFEPPSTNDAPALLSGCKEVVKRGATQPQKPPLPVTVKPPIWAESRQEVCESFVHFRSYQSGVYSSKDVVKGYLLGGSPASRDIFHRKGRLIISHGGGKAESVLDYRVGPARFQQAQDQEVTDKSVRALIKTHTDRRPLVLLADDKYVLFPFDLGASGYTYVVLGLYWISHAWEYQPASNGCGRVVRWKFAFQWCEEQGDPWWTSATTRNCQSDDGQDSSLRNVIECAECSKQSPLVYSQGWMCLNPTCSSFWRLGGREPEQLDYDTTFLCPVAAAFSSLPDLLPAKPAEAIDSVTTSFAFSKGWHCKECGRLSSRFKWECWECSNCQSNHKVFGRLRLAKEFWHQRPSADFLHSHIGKLSGIVTVRPEPFELHNGGGFTNYLTFILPYERGRIHLILGTPLGNREADKIFEQYQQQAKDGELLLRRYPLKTNKVRGAFLTNYFSQNSGETYQYIGGTGNTVPFDKAPSSVCGALALIKERSRLALQRDVPFNEILSAAYMERQKMSFHSDSERGLGPVVASLSLGSAAFMHFRPRVTAKEAKCQMSIALTLVLRHGDVLIMEGDGVQQYYEHTVVPMNFRIAATARCIGTGTA